MTASDIHSGRRPLLCPWGRACSHPKDQAGSHRLRHRFHGGGQQIAKLAARYLETVDVLAEVAQVRHLSIEDHGGMMCSGLIRDLVVRAGAGAVSATLVAARWRHTLPAPPGSSWYAYKQSIGAAPMADEEMTATIRQVAEPKGERDDSRTIVMPKTQNYRPNVPGRGLQELAAEQARARAARVQEQRRQMQEAESRRAARAETARVQHARETAVVRQLQQQILKQKAAKKMAKTLLLNKLVASLKEEQLQKAKKRALVLNMIVALHNAQQQQHHDKAQDLANLATIVSAKAKIIDAVTKRRR